MICTYCKKDFKRKTIAKTCSLKCRLLEKVKTSDSCWEWQGVIMKNGYGKLRYETKFLGVHRVSFEIFKGKIPDGMWVLHKCDNKKCVNPDHLWLGTVKENAADAKKKGLYKGKGTTGKKWSEETRKKIKLNLIPQRGEKSSRSILKDSDVYEIKELLKSDLTLQEIGLKYGVSKSAIHNIKTGRRWSHL